MINVQGAICTGGVLYFTQQADMSTLLADVQLARPTFIMLVPRLAEMILDEYEAACARAGIAADDKEGRKGVMESQRFKLLGERLLWIVVCTQLLYRHALPEKRPGCLYTVFVPFRRAASTGRYSAFECAHAGVPQAMLPGARVRWLRADRGQLGRERRMELDACIRANLAHPLSDCMRCCRLAALSPWMVASARSTSRSTSW
jgi:hypothetical protein